MTIHGFRAARKRLLYEVVIELHQANLNNCDIAELVGYSRETVRRILIDCGYAIKRQPEEMIAAFPSDLQLRILAIRGKEQ